MFPRSQQNFAELKLELLTTRVLRCGKTSRMMLNRIYGHSVAFSTRWSLWSPLFEPKTCKACIKRWSEGSMRRSLRTTLKICQMLFVWCCKLYLSWGRTAINYCTKSTWASIRCLIRCNNRPPKRLKTLYWTPSRSLRTWNCSVINYRSLITRTWRQ